MSSKTDGPLIIQASFFWKNNEPGGFGITFTPEYMDPSEMTRVFQGPVIKEYFRKSDEQLGTNIVKTMLSQLAGISAKRQTEKMIRIQDAMLAALNIAWLSSRGFIPQDNYNGTQYVYQIKDSA